MILVAAARKKMEPLHHLLLCGQPGMGKVTLAKIIAAEMGVGFKIISGKTIDKDILGLLTNMGKGDFLIIEQIEALRKQALEVLFQAMADSTIDVVIDSGPVAHTVKISLLQFNLIGTTTRLSQVDKRLNNLMFSFNFTPYKKDEIGKIISVSATQLGINVEPVATNLLAEQCNRCPGEALLVLKKVHKYAIAYADGQITSTIARNALAMFGSNNNSPIFERQSIPDDVKMFVWQRDRGCCAKCSRQENLEYDHIIPISKGGSNTARNIQLLCEKCNRSKSANIV
jgi:Holliday junction DNA helicase RuvB